MRIALVILIAAIATTSLAVDRTKRIYAIVDANELAAVANGQKKQVMGNPSKGAFSTEADCRVSVDGNWILLEWYKAEDHPGKSEIWDKLTLWGVSFTEYEYTEILPVLDGTNWVKGI